MSAVTSPNMLKNCLSETIPDCLETFLLAPPVPVIACSIMHNRFGLPQGQKPPQKTGLLPKQLLLAHTAAFLKGNAAIPLLQERNNVRPISSFRCNLTKGTDLCYVGMLEPVPALSPLQCSWPRLKAASLQYCSLNFSSLQFSF